MSEVRSTSFTITPDGTTERVTCHNNSRRHLEPGISQPLFSSVKRRVNDGDVTVGTKVVFRRHENDPFLANRWETLEAHATADKKRQASHDLGAKQPLLL